LESLTEERLHLMSRNTGIAVDAVCRRPLVKCMTGGSDDHFAMFSGSTGTLLHLSGLDARRANGERPADLALEALRSGSMAPYGNPCEEERLSAALLDYTCQLALHMEDPGLMRILLHKGGMTDKLLALGVSNAVFELRRRPISLKVLRAIHGALHGESPPMLYRLLAGRTFRPLLDRLTGLAQARLQGPESFQACLSETLPALFHDLGEIVASKVDRNLLRNKTQAATAVSDRARASFKIPSHLRVLLGGGDQRSPSSGLRLGKLLDGLPVPAISAFVVGGNLFAAFKVLHRDRPFAEAFSHRLGRFESPRRTLWITDTMGDRNGVAHALDSVLQEARRRDLPLDILACSSTLEEGPHLRVLRPLTEFALPMYEGQMLRVPDFAQMHRVFREGGYDRIVSSTEGPMGWGALLLRKAFNVPVHAFLHTDWLDFGRRRLGMGDAAVDRLRRVARAWLQAHDAVFVLNREQEEWLVSSSMGLAPSRVHRTAHWADPIFSPRGLGREEVFPGIASNDPVLLFVGRLSEEKGVLELPVILAKVRERHPRARLVLCGTGPADERLRRELPDAVFLGWTDKEMLARCYSAADMLLLPSRFDTFGCVVLEAMACGLPVLAYACKGPADIVEPGVSGFLGETVAELSEHAVRLLDDPALRKELCEGALARAARYDREAILDDLLRAMEGPQGQALARTGCSSDDSSLWAEILGMANGKGEA